MTQKDVRIGVEFEFIIPNISREDKRDMEKWTKLSTAYYEYDIWEDLMGEYIDGNISTPPQLPIYALKMGYEQDDIIPDPDEVFRRPKDEFLKLVDKYLNINLWPFDNPTITDNPDFKWSDSWIIKPDYSLTGCGFEVVSPKLTMEEFYDIMPRIFSCILECGVTTEDCGLHFSISFNDVDDMEKILDINKLAEYINEDDIYYLFPNRKDNGYAISIWKDMQDNLNRGVKAITSGHFMAVNLEHLGTSNEYVEFRYIGGKDYHKRWSDIKILVSMFIKALRMACSNEG